MVSGSDWDEHGPGGARRQHNDLGPCALLHHSDSAWGAAETSPWDRTRDAQAICASQACKSLRPRLPRSCLHFSGGKGAAAAECSF